MDDEQMVEELAAAMTRAFRDYTGTRTGDAMWNLDMEKTFELAAPAALAWLAERGRLAPDAAEVVYICTTPTPWQEASEAIYGPIAVEERDEFSRRVVAALGGEWSWFASFPLMPPSTVPTPSGEDTTDA